MTNGTMRGKNPRWSVWNYRQIDLFDEKWRCKKIKNFLSSENRTYIDPKTQAFSMTAVRYPMEENAGPEKWVIIMMEPKETETRNFIRVSLFGRDIPAMSIHCTVAKKWKRLGLTNGLNEFTVKKYVRDFEACKKKEDNMNEILFLRHCALKNNDFVTAHILSFIV